MTAGGVLSSRLGLGRLRLDLILDDAAGLVVAALRRLGESAGRQSEEGPDDQRREKLC